MTRSTESTPLAPDIPASSSSSQRVLLLSHRASGCTMKKALVVMMVVSIATMMIVFSQMYTPGQLMKPVAILATRMNFSMPRFSTTVRPKQGADDYLLTVLESRLKRFAGERHNLSTLIDCATIQKKTLAQQCVDKSCPAKFSASPRQRLKQILKTRAPFPEKYRKALAAATARVKPHQYIFLSGASSNHMPQLQNMVKTIRDNLFPAMKGRNFTFIIYDFGLTPADRQLTEYNCNCTILDFPFKEFPEFVSYMLCFAWKPLAIASLIAKTEYLVWMDSSVRWKGNINLDALFQRAKERSFQIRFAGKGSISARTNKAMADFYGDALCQYSSYPEFAASFGVFYNDRFMKEAVLQPWISCAMNRSCMCLENHMDFQRCRRRSRGIQGRFSMCHRFDQSSLGFIWTKLLLHQRAMVEMPGLRSLDLFVLARHKGMNWFLWPNETNTKKPDYTVFRVGS